MWRKFTAYFVPSPHNAYRPHLLAKPWLIFFLTVILTSEGVFVAGILARQAQAPLPAAVVPGEVIAFTNVERAQNTDGVLTENSLLDKAAQAKAEDMARNGYFSHNGPDGKEPWIWIQEAGYAYQYAGENLAVRFDDSENVVNAWMASPTHRANIVKEVYREIGVGVADGMYKGSPATFVVQYFGTPLAVAAQVAPPAPVLLAQENIEVEPAPLAQVEGAATEKTPTTATTSATNTVPPMEVQILPPHDPVTQQVAKLVTDSNSSAPWVVGGVATFLLVLLALAFFIHIEIQSHEMVLGGGLVVAMAILFLILNVQLPETVGNKNQSASVANIRANILVGEDAVSSEFLPLTATSSILQ
ncbi:CAP domain-containing protein [Acetobacteraceae bacterium]|nr:CAP domain-containing protein [Candidatus Parcubacteria bacterium]